MSNRIDQRIVEMSFENSKFEKGILQSQNSLKDFSKALDQTNTTKDFSSLETSLATIAKSFTVMGGIGVGVLREIGANAVNTGNALFKSLAIDPITSGFGEMELKMNSTQTIMASTGESLAVVNQRLQELNEYSDQTIYSFSDMTANIGKFTNAGVKLEDAVASIKGISNAAALSGANAEEASRAMYNFAQALSAGFVKLADWKSIELANMATVEFKQQLLDSAVAAGTLAKQSDGMYKVLSRDASGSAMDGAISATKNFNESLSYQWMTTTALTKTLGEYADSTTDIGKRATLAATQVTTFTKLMDTLRESVGSGWSQTFEIMFGDFDEARNLWSSMNVTLGATINDLADARNALLSGGLSSGWKQFMQEGISDTDAFGKSLREVAKTSGIDIEAMINKTGSLEAALKGNWLTGDMLTATVSKMAASIENMSDAQLKNTNYTAKSRAELIALRDALISGRISAEEFASKMSKMSGRENIIQGLKNSVVALLTALRPISKAFDQIFPPMTVNTLYQMTENFKNFTDSLIISETTANRIQRTFAGLFAVLDIGWEVVKLLGGGVLEIVKAFVPLNGGFLETTATIGDFLVIVNQLIKQSGIFEYGLIGIKIAAILVRNTILTMTNSFIGFVRTLLSVEHPLQYLGEVIQSIFSNIFTSMSDGVRWISTKFIGSLNSLQKFFSEKLNLGDGSTINAILDSLKEFLAYVVDGGADGIVSLSDALNSLDFSRIATFVTGGILLVFINQLTRLTKVSADLVATTNGLITQFSKKLFAPVTQLKDFAFAVGVLSASLYVLSTIPYERMKLGLASLAAGMVIFTASYAAMQAITVIGTKKLNGAEAMKSALNLTAMAGGLAILAIAVNKVSQIDRSAVWNSVAVVTAMMGVITAYQALTVAISLIPGTRAANIGMGLMASGLLGLITIVLLMNTIQPEMITDSLQKLTGAMLMLAGIQALFAVASRASGGMKVGVNVLGIAGGLLALIAIAQLVSILDSKKLMAGAKSILLLGGILAAIQAMFGLASRITGGVKFKTNILSMQLGIASMVLMAAVVGGMDQTKLQNGIVNLTKMAGLVGAIELVTALSARIGNGQPLQKILGSITLTMVAFTGIIGVVGNFKQETIDRGFATIVKMAGLIMGIELMTAVIGSIRGSARGAGVLIGMTITILTITASLSLLAMIDQEALGRAADSLMKVIAAVGIMGIGLAVLIQTLSGMTTGLGLLQRMVGVIIPGFVALLTILGAALVFLATVNSFSPLLQSMDWGSLLKFAAGIGVITILIGAFTVLASIPGLGAGLQSLKALAPGLIAIGTLVAATAGLFAIIGSVLPVIDRVSWSSFGKLIVGLSFIALMTAGFATLAPAFKLLGPGFKPALVGLAAAVVGVAGVVLAFAGLATLMGTVFNGRSEYWVSGIDQLIIVADGIGRFIGAIIGGFNSQVLVGFGEGMAKFSNAVSMIKPESFAGVESLAKAMLTLTGASLLDGLARFVGFGNTPVDTFGKQIEGLIKALGNLAQINEAFKLIGANTIDVAVQTIDNRKQSLSDSFTNVFELVLRNTKTYVKEFDSLGFNVIQGFQDGIIRGQEDAEKAAEAVADAVVAATRTRLDVHSPSRVFAEIGAWLPVGLGNGIKKNSKVAILASANMGGAVEDSLRKSLGIHSPSTVGQDIGKWLPPGISNGINQTKNQLLETAKSLGVDVSTVTANSFATSFKNQEGMVTSGVNTLLDMLTGKQSFQAISEQMGINSGLAMTDGVAAGLGAGGSKVKSAAAKLGKDAFDALKESINKRKEYNLITIDEEIAAWDNFSKLYKVGTEMRMKADKELGRVRYENSRTWIEKEKYYKRLSLEEELKAWETVASRYKVNPEYRIQAEREIFRLKEELWQQEYQSKMDAIDDAKYYGRMNLQQELAAQKEIREMTEESSKERKKADREVYKLEKDISEANLSYENRLKQVEKDRMDARKRATDEYYQKEKEINDQLQRDIESVRKSYEDALSSRTKTLYSSYGLFDKVEAPAAVDGAVLTQNLENQTKSFELWQSNINSLTAKGVDDGLIQELREMGPKANAQLIALNSLSSDELTKYVTLWRTKSQQARLQATFELQALKASTETEIGALNSAASVKLQEYTDMWNETMATIEENTKAQVEAIALEWNTQVGSMTQNGIKLIRQFSYNWSSEVNNVVNNTKNQFLDLQKFMDGFKLQMPSFSDGPQANSNYAGIGANIVTGLSTGMLNASGGLLAVTQGLNQKLQSSIKDYWMINSPSKRTTETGMYIVMGLSEGIRKFTQLPVTMAEGLGGKVVAAMETSMSSIPELFDSGVDEIKIKPVVDLTNVKAGVKDVKDMFGDVTGLDLSTTRSLLPTSINPKASQSLPVVTTASKQSTVPQAIHFTQNNYSPKALSRLEIYRQTRNQISAIKGW